MHRGSAFDLPAVAALAWTLLLAVAEQRRRSNPPHEAPASFGIDASGELAALPGDDPAALLRWQPSQGWLAGPGAPPAASALFDLYLPICNASARAPLVVGHLGQSLDGYIATRSGDSDYVTGPRNILHLHRMRALCDAVLVGAGTVAADDPKLTARHAGGRDPVRVVIDPTRRLDSALGVFSDGAAPTLVVCDEAYLDRDRDGAVDVIGVPSDASGLDLGAVLRALRARSLDTIFIEGGGRTVSAFLEQGLLDRLQIAIAPIVIGRGRPGLQLAAKQRLDECLRLEPRYFVMGDDVLCDFDLRGGRAAAPRLQRVD